MAKKQTKQYTDNDTEEILDYPEMEKTLNVLYPLFQQYGWTWGDKVPNRDEIQETIESLVKGMLNRGGDFTSSGRLTVNNMGDSVTVSLEIGEFYLDK